MGLSTVWYSKSRFVGLGIIWFAGFGKFSVEFGTVWSVVIGLSFFWDELKAKPNGIGHIYNSKLGLVYEQLALLLINAAECRPSKASTSLKTCNFHAL